MAGPHTSSNIILRFFAVMFVLFLPASAVAKDATIIMTPAEVNAGAEFSMPVKILNAENVAGIKLVFEYDKNVLGYREAKKTAKTAPLMLVVNDREPGKLIIVMAGAKGVGGSEFDLLTIDFKAATPIREKISTTIRLTDIELVSEQLKEIPCPLTETVVTVFPEKN